VGQVDLSRCSAKELLPDPPERMQPVLAAYDEWTKQFPDGEVDRPARR